MHNKVARPVPTNVVVVLVVLVRVDVLPKRGAQLLRHLQRKRRDLLVELLHDGLQAWARGMDGAAVRKLQLTQVQRSHNRF